MMSNKAVVSEVLYPIFNPALTISQKVNKVLNMESSA